ncbi:MAG: trigger factor [Gammaproteobacteria bacterium CG11_big_fil_rev_8_21_14_0_20_46_22]|nr:MAG: trigger factor [Gammaproteobacteria bacterium CG12_big_fil_rev_8_21_14_0_65_46_12]PIR10514.1 MAG: trigger factor [Gammaproteobacteria bacterium CG11_big_fil_rev_8_21_14_0_20_46_22]
MQVTLAPADGLKRQITVTIPAERMEAGYKAKFNQVKQKAKIDGFRPGKVPNKVIESRFGESIYQELVSDLIRDTLFEALQKEDLNPAGMPTITEMKAEKGQAMEYVAAFEVFPEIHLKTLSGVKFEKTAAELKDSDIDQVLERLRQQRVEWVEVDRASQKDDQVTIDFDGEIDGEAIKGGKGKDMPLVLGSGSMIPGFEAGITGMKAGDEKMIDVTFPAEYHEKTLSGKAAKFKINVHKVCEPKLPALDDSLAEAFGIKEGGLEAMKADMRKHMAVELENGLKVLNKTAAFDRLLELNELDIPSSAVEQEMQAMHEQSMRQMAGEKEVPPLTDAAREYLREPAGRRVKMGLLIAEVIKQKELKPDAGKVKEMVERMSGSYESPAEFVSWFMSDKERLRQIEAVVLEDQVAEVLMKEADVSEKAVSYDDVVNAQQHGHHH